MGIDAGTAAMLAGWMAKRKNLAVSSHSPLICTLDGGSIDSSYVRHLLPRLAPRAGIQKRVHAHGLRHAYAVELDREGASISVIRDLLGHSSARTTDRYLRRLGASEAVDVARAREWQGLGSLRGTTTITGRIDGGRTGVRS